MGFADVGSYLATPEPPIRVTAMPANTNPYGGVFGGWLMSQTALAAGSLASRHARGKAVVVAAHALSFDHRAIDGADGARLMKAFKALVESPLGLVA